MVFCYSWRHSSPALTLFFLFATFYDGYKFVVVQHATLDRSLFPRLLDLKWWRNILSQFCLKDIRKVLAVIPFLPQGSSSTSQATRTNFRSNVQLPFPTWRSLRCAGTRVKKQLRKFVKAAPTSSFENWSPTFINRSFTLVRRERSDWLASSTRQLSNFRQPHQKAFDLSFDLTKIEKWNFEHICTAWATCCNKANVQCYITQPLCLAVVSYELSKGKVLTIPRQACQFPQGRTFWMSLVVLPRGQFLCFKRKDKCSVPTRSVQKSNSRETEDGSLKMWLQQNSFASEIASTCCASFPYEYASDIPTKTPRNRWQRALWGTRALWVLCLYL